MKSLEKCWPRPARATITGLTVLVVICFASSLAVAASIGEGPTLVQYSVVSVGANASIMVNSGPILGMVLVGDGTTVTSAGGGNGQITGGVHNSPPTTGCGPTGTSCFSSLATPPTVTVVPSSVGMNAFTEAAELSADASALPPNLTFTGSFSGTRTFTGNGGLNVINFASLQNPKLTFSGTASDIFVINVSGSFNTNQPITLNGVLASHILWNFTGTGTVLQTSGGNSLVGTFLATKTGANFQFSSLMLTGQLINTGGHIQWVSNSRMLGFAPFIPREEAVPEPEASSLLLFGMGLVAGAGALFRKTAARFRTAP